MEQQQPIVKKDQTLKVVNLQQELIISSQFKNWLTQIIKAS